jgi:predicted DNA-binding protein (MmcQ/YjbR family)
VNVEFIQRFCLSFPHAKENLQWGDNLCFKVGGKIFAVLALSSVPPRLSFKCTPEKFGELVEQDGIVPAAYVGRYYWVSVERLEALPWSELQDLLAASYGMVVAKAKVEKVAEKRVRKRVRAENRHR